MVFPFMSGNSSSLNTLPNAPQISRRAILAISLPMTLAYISAPIVGIVDTGLAGQLEGAAPQGGIAVGGVIIGFIFTALNFLQMGTTGLMAQSYGAGNQVEQQAVFWRAALIAVILGLALWGTALPVRDLGFWALGASEAVRAKGEAYYIFRALGFPFALFNLVVTGWCIGRSRIRAALVFHLFLNTTNIAVSAALVLVFGWGVEGIGLGSALADIGTAMLGLGYVLITSRFMPSPKREDILKLHSLKKLFDVNRDIMIRSVALFVCFFLFMRESSITDDETLAANAILLNFVFLSAYFLDGLASAAEQLTGQTIGARAYASLPRLFRLICLWGYGIAFAISCFLLIGGNLFIHVLTKSPQVGEIAAQFLFWAALTPLTGALAFQLDGVYIGATWTQAMRNLMLLCAGIYLILWRYLPDLWGNHGLWLTLNLFLLVRGALLLVWLPKSLARLRNTA